MTEILLYFDGAAADTQFQLKKIQDFIIAIEPTKLIGASQNTGELVRLRFSTLLLELLDQFHGFNKQDPDKSLFIRQEVSVESNHQATRAWTYRINDKKLSDKQKSYILKLGKTMGREIIPIDLPLYRELINLELIIDKGRRVALSKLGHEVFRALSYCPY